MPLDHLDACAAQARDHLRVARVVAFVRAEVEDAQALGEDFLDVHVAPLARDRALLVVARDHLADQAEREELHADDDEQHAEREQRPLADRVAERTCGSSGRRAPRPDEAEQQAEPAEEVQRPVPVAAHERDGEQVEEPAQVALEPVARAAVLARAVVHRELGDAVALLVREHGDEAVQLAVEHEAVHDLGAVRLEAAVHVVQAEARTSSRRRG